MGSLESSPLCRIMFEGKDSDAVRAIRELNAMEDEERAHGGGAAPEFEELLTKIARRPRLLPFQDEDDKMVIASESRQANLAVPQK